MSQQHAPGPQARRHAIGQGDDPVDQNVVYSGGRRRRLLERRRVANRDGIEHTNVCTHSDGQSPAVMQAEVMGREAAHAVNGAFQR